MQRARSIDTDTSIDVEALDRPVGADAEASGRNDLQAVHEPDRHRTRAVVTPQDVAPDVAVEVAGRGDDAVMKVTFHPIIPKSRNRRELYHSLCPIQWILTKSGKIGECASDGGLARVTPRSPASTGRASRPSCGRYHPGMSAQRRIADDLAGLLTHDGERATATEK